MRPSNTIGRKIGDDNVDVDANAGDEKNDDVSLRETDADCDKMMTGFFVYHSNLP